MRKKTARSVHGTSQEGYLAAGAWSAGSADVPLVSAGDCFGGSTCLARPMPSGGPASGFSVAPPPPQPRQRPSVKAGRNIHARDESRRADATGVPFSVPRMPTWNSGIPWTTFVSLRGGGRLMNVRWYRRSFPHLGPARNRRGQGSCDGVSLELRGHGFNGRPFRDDLVISAGRTRRKIPCDWCERVSPPQPCLYPRCEGKSTRK